MVEGSFGKLQVTKPGASPKTTGIPIVPASGAVSPSVAAKANNNPQDSDRQPDNSGAGVPADSRPMPKPYIAADKLPVVLIVEDTTELAEVIQATLERMGMQASYETHGSRALAKLEALDPDVVLLDISLPDMTGWKILEVIKARAEKSQRMPVVIIITAHDDPANRLVGKLQDVYSYLVKPFTSDAIERVVTEAIDRARR